MNIAHKQLLLDLARLRLKSSGHFENFERELFGFGFPHICQWITWDLDEATADVSSMGSLRHGDLCGMLRKQRMEIIIDEWIAEQSAHPEARHRAVEVVSATPAAEPARKLGSPSAKPQAVAHAPVVTDSASNAPGRARRDLLVPVIEAAQKECKDPFDTSAVWAPLSQMAQAGKRPLVGLSDEGIKWVDANDEIQFLKRKNLGERLRRMKRKAR